MRFRGALVIATILGLAGLGALGLSLGDRIELADRITIPDLLPVIVPLVLVLAILVLVLQLRAKGEESSAPQRRPSWLVRIVLVVLLVGAVVAILRSRRSDPRAGGPPELGRTPGQGGIPQVTGGGGGGWALVILAVCAILGVLAVIAVARANRPRPGPPDEEEELLRAVAAGREALRDIDADASARNAVIAAYAAMENSLAVQGIARVRTDAPADLLARAAGLLEPPAAAAARDLTALFELARFSSDELPADAIESARTAFTTIESALRTTSAGAR